MNGRGPQRSIRGFHAAAALFAGALAALLPATSAPAQDAYPTRPLTMVVPFPPGGSTDVVARIIAKEMSSRLGQQVLVENRSGAAGAIGMRTVARAAPDGYTVAVSGVGTSVILELLGQQLGYSPETDLVTIVHLGSLGFVIAARTDFGANDFKGTLAIAKKEPLRYGTAGAGTPGHLAMEYLKVLAGVQFVHVPYKGTAPLMTDLTGKHIDIGILTLPGTAAQVKAGAVKALAVTTRKRDADMPDVPTVAELGFPGYSAEIWNVLTAPAGTPAATVRKLNETVNAILAMPEIKAQFTKQQLTPFIMSPKETSDFVAAERVKWAEVVKKSGAKFQ